MTADLRAFPQVLAAQITPTPAKPTGCWRSYRAWLSLLELNNYQQLMPDPFDFDLNYVSRRQRLLGEAWVVIRRGPSRRVH